MGDFNAVKNQNERRGVGSQDGSSECVRFQRFIDEMELFDISVFGRNFTWYKATGRQ